MKLGAARVAPENLVPHQIAAPTTNAEHERSVMAKSKTLAGVKRRDEAIKRLTALLKKEGVSERAIADALSLKDSLPVKPRRRGRPPSWGRTNETRLYFELCQEIKNIKGAPDFPEYAASPTATGEEIDRACAKLAKKQYWIDLAQPQQSRARPVSKILKDHFWRFRAAFLAKEKAAAAEGKLAPSLIKAIADKKPIFHMWARVFTDEKGNIIFGADGLPLWGDDGKAVVVPRFYRMRKKNKAS